MKPAPAPFRHEIRMTVSADFMSLLEEVRAELSHSHPGAPLETLLAECMRVTLAARRKHSRGEAARPRARIGEPVGRSRDIPAAIRRAVWKRDGRQCTFVSEDGRRCTAAHRLQLHHEQPYGRGGPPTVENIRIMCLGHNDLMARRDYGDDVMDRYTKRGKQEAADRPEPA